MASNMEKDGSLKICILFRKYLMVMSSRQIFNRCTSIKIDDFCTVTSIKSITVSVIKTKSPCATGEHMVLSGFGATIPSFNVPFVFSHILLLSQSIA